jgi:hypothetical protein
MLSVTEWPRVPSKQVRMLLRLTFGIHLLMRIKLY